jgi:hypothetical protein
MALKHMVLRMGVSNRGVAWVCLMVSRRGASEGLSHAMLAQRWALLRGVLQSTRISMGSVALPLPPRGQTPPSLLPPRLPHANAAASDTLA